MLFSFFLLYTCFKKSKLNKFENESSYLLVMHIFFKKIYQSKGRAQIVSLFETCSSVKSPERKVEYKIFYNFILQKYLIYRKTTKKSFFFLARITRNLERTITNSPNPVQSASKNENVMTVA